MSKSPSLRRIQADIRELSLDPSPSFHAAPLENDMFEWHFTIRGAEGTDFEGGIYHGRILLPPEYPFKPPHIIFLTPSGRFETNTKVCLSFSAFHPELWQPAWGIRLILEALISFLPTPADGAVGALDWSSKERKRLAIASQSWKCTHCGAICSLIPEIKDADGGPKKISSTSFAKEIAELYRLQKEAEANRGESQMQEAKVNNDEMGDLKTKPREQADPLTTEALEEEIVFGDYDGDEVAREEAASDDVTEQIEIEATTGAVQTVMEQQQSTIGMHEVHAEAASSVARNVISKSWLFEPLLNVLIILLLVICYLLFQKWLDLSEELREFQAWEYKQQLESQLLETVQDDDAATEL